jgi:uncharacterized protein involved in exopolysaccharide biosynthesis
MEVHGMTASDAAMGENDQASAVRLTDLLAYLGSIKWRIALLTIVGTAASVAVALYVPRYYVATTLLMPSQASQGMGNSPMVQLGSLVGVAGGALSAKSNDELYIGLLKSRSILGTMTKRFDLQRRYTADDDQDAQKILMGRTTVMSDKKAGLLSLSVEDTDPKLAAELANYYVVALEHLTSTLAITEAQQRRVFFEDQVAKTKAKLNEAEIRFARLQREKGFLMTDVLAESGVRGGVEVRQQIATREVQLAAMESFATSQNPEAKRLAAEIQALKQKQIRLDQGQASDGGQRSESMETVNAFRDVKVYTAALEGLVRQLEMSRVEEAKDSPSLQQVDPAVPPQYPVKPSRVGIVLAGTALTAFFASTLALVVFAFRRLRSPRWAKVKAAWAWR